jgi:CheY-like chemotaxis protein
MAIRILVVDDASFIRDMVKKHLRDRIPGVEVYDATDGNRALAAMKHQTMDIILSDWEMPNMSGEELLRVVRANPISAETPFVMISSRGDRNHVIKAVEAGVSDYLSKPFTPDELLRKVFKQLKLIGKEPAQGAKGLGNTQGIAFASVDVLTGGRPPEAAISTAPLADTSSSASLLTGGARPAKPVPKKPAAKGKAQLRFANNVICPCVVRELSLQALNGLIQRNDQLPRLFDQAAVDIELGDTGEIARVNGYVYSVQAGEQRPETQVVKIVIRFVDNDPEKFEVLSQYIAKL